MNKQRTLILFITTIILTGCMQTPNPKPSVSNLKDVNYKVDKDGNIALEKKHVLSDNNETILLEEVTKNTKSKQNKGYEVVPNFEKKYTKNLTLKNKQITKHKKIIVRGKKVKVSVESIPMNEFIDLMFANVLKLNYTVSKDVMQMKTPITLYMSTAQPKQEVFDVVSELLKQNAVNVKKNNGIIFLSKLQDKNTNTTNTEDIQIGYGREISSTISDNTKMLMFVPVNYIDPRKIVRLIRLAGIKKSVIQYPYKNIMFMKDTAQEIRKILKIVNLTDKPFMLHNKSLILEFKNIDISVFLKRIKNILASSAIPTVSSPLQNGLLITPIPELNSLYVISPKKAWIDLLLYWKNKLDKISEISPDPKFYTYKVKNRKADELAAALNSVVEIKLSNTHTKLVNKAKKNTKTTLTKNKHSIIADLPTNTLMMQLLPSEYRELLPLITKLDALPLQVLVEVTLAEVTLTDTFNLGFEYALRNNAAAGVQPITSAILSSTFGGSGFAASYNSKNLDVAIDAYAENKLLSILSKPKILILNNQTGNINVGTQIPIITSEASATDIGTGTDPSILRNVSYRNTGVIVGLTPTINSNGILTMNVNLQLSEAQLNDTSSIDSPLIVNRTLSTSLILKQGQTVMLGGLISKNKSTTDSGVPYLMDIPWIGTLFKSKNEKTVKTELIMLIKPYIIENTIQMNEETKKYKSILKTLNKYSFI